MGTFPNPDTQFKPGQSGNPLGKPKGRRNLSMIIRDMLEEEIDWEMISIEKAQDYAVKYGGRPGWEAIVAVATKEAMLGNVKAMTWLAKSGYGDKLTLDAEEGFFDGPQRIEVEIVNPEAIDEVKTEPDSEPSPPSS